MDDMTMGQRIAEGRKKLGLSQEALGEKLGVSRQAISKWEADGAVPEIDKLITLSRLFSVSVGWLLGVEVQPEQKADELSESQLKMVEEIVQQYQPQKARNIPLYNFLVVLVGVIGIVALCISSWMFTGKDYSSHITNLEADINGIHSQISSLTNRVDSIAANQADNDQSDYLSGYQFRLGTKTDQYNLTMSLEVIPKVWDPDTKATLHIRHNSKQFFSAPFAWDGSAYLIYFSLEYKNGYEYWLALESPDGGHVSIPLPDSVAQNPLRAYAITCEVVTMGIGRYDADAATLSIPDLELHLRMPDELAHVLHEIHWDKCDYILRHNRGKQWTTLEIRSLLKPNSDDAFTEGWLYDDPVFSLPEMEEGDGLELWCRTALSNGLETRTLLCTWAYVNGELIQSIPAE